MLDRKVGGCVPSPSCQVTGCFEPASLYVVIKETDIDQSELEGVGREQTLVINRKERDQDLKDINTFKLILYLCLRHNYDLKYLLKENELEIAKRRYLF